MIKCESKKAYQGILRNKNYVKEILALTKNEFKAYFNKIFIIIGRW